METYNNRVDNYNSMHKQLNDNINSYNTNLEKYNQDNNAIDKNKLDGLDNNIMDKNKLDNDLKEIQNFQEEHKKKRKK